MAKVYSFTNAPEAPDLLGNKGANLVVMTKLKLPVPPGFVVPITIYREYRKGGPLPVHEIEEALAALEQLAGRRLGQGLTVSVRSSAPISMPGMMDTVLNVADFPTMLSCIKRIFDSWDNLRAVEYRRLHHIPSDLGTAAIIQVMVMGNANERSGTGVVFTRNPSTGAKGLFGEYLPQAQGEDIVSGQRTPQPVEALKAQMPEVYAQLDEIGRNLEDHYRDMQDIEFTVENGTLHILQTRSGKRSGQAAVKIAVEMVHEGLLTPEKALLRVTAQDLGALLHRRIDPARTAQPLTRGLNAAPGAATGKVVFDIAEAVNMAKMDEQVILVRTETSPDDILGISSAHGVLTSRGGLTSHAAIVTRALGKPCVCGASDIEIDLKGQRFRVNGQVVRKGQEITIDGSTGEVFLGALPLIEVEVHEDLDQLLWWANQHKRLGVMANADTAEMIVQAKKFGAEGVGLCRTERQFNAPERLSAIREFILAGNAGERLTALAHLKQLQKEDFISIFRALQGLPIIIRLLDLPLHEFLPHEPAPGSEIWKRSEELREVNPMMGHRGVRLAVTYPELYQMQIDAISEAKREVDANVSIMIPQVITTQELLWVKRMIADRSVRVGIMIETVRACLRADSLAHVADFFSFGTNDLTQATYSFSREDAEKKFLSSYIDHGILEDNPFEVIDIRGVGRLMEATINWAREVKPKLDIGVCGEHGGEPRSIRFFHRTGLDYVSVSAFRIPIARLVAAQAAIEDKTLEEKNKDGQKRAEDAA